MTPQFFTLRTHQWQQAQRLAAGIGSLVVIALFWPGLTGGLLFDDRPTIEFNSALHLSSLTLDSLRGLWHSFPHGLSGRPLAMATFGIEHALWGLDPYVIKRTNVLLHALNMLLLVALIQRVLTMASFGRSWTAPSPGLLLAVFLALAWALHPLQVSTVLYAVQRMEIMALTFTLLGLLTYLRGRALQIDGRGHGWPWFLLTACFTALAFLCKETGLLLPGFAFCLELTVLRFRGQQRGQELALKGFYLAGGILAALFFVLYIWPAHTGPGSYISRDFTWDERLLTQLRVLPMYLWWTVWPDPQNYVFYYDNFPKSTGLFQPVTTFLGGTLLAGLLATGFLLRRQAPLVALGILWFFTAHFLTSNIVSLELVFEHRNYFAILGVLLVAAGLIDTAGRKWRRLPVIPAMLALVVGLGILTAITSSIWGNQLALALEFRGQNPGSERALYDLGENYRRMSEGNPNSPFFGMALSTYREAAKLPNASPLPEQRMILMHAQADREVDPELWEDLIEKLDAGSRNYDQIAATEALLDAYNLGIGLDPDRVMEAGIALLNKRGVSPNLYIKFALHAIEALDDVDLASRLVSIAVTIADDPTWNTGVIRLLESRGHGGLAEKIKGQIGNNDDQPETVTPDAF